MNTINPLNNPQFPADSNSWVFLQEMILLVMKLANFGAGNYIVEGAVITGPNISAGTVVINGEVLPLEAGVVTTTVIIEETSEDVLDNGVNYVDVYTNRKVKFGTGAGQIDWSTFYDARNIFDKIFKADASQLVSGVLALARIPNLPASKITSELLALARGGTNNDSFTAEKFVGLKSGGDKLESLDHAEINTIDFQSLSHTALPGENSDIGYVRLFVRDRFADSQIDQILYMRKWWFSGGIWYDEVIGSQIGAACPYLYVVLDESEINLMELIPNQKYITNDREHIAKIDTDMIVLDNGIFTIDIKEEKDETSYLEYVELLVDGVRVVPQNRQREEIYWVIQKGESLKLEFDLSHFKEIERCEIITKGYYVPLN